MRKTKRANERYPQKTGFNLLKDAVVAGYGAKTNCGYLLWGLKKYFGNSYFFVLKWVKFW